MNQMVGDKSVGCRLRTGISTRGRLLSQGLARFRAQTVVDILLAQESRIIWSADSGQQTLAIDSGQLGQLWSTDSGQQTLASS